MLWYLLTVLLFFSAEVHIKTLSMTKELFYFALLQHALPPIFKPITLPVDVMFLIVLELNDVKFTLSFFEVL